jgi:ribosome-associated protein
VSDKLVSLLAKQLDEDKAENILEINLVGKSPIADAMIIASGRSQRHVAALADHLVRKLKDEGIGKPRVEGLPSADWVLIDAGDVIVHIFRPEVREFYNLERIWAGDTPSKAAARKAAGQPEAPEA